MTASPACTRRALLCMAAAGAALAARPALAGLALPLSASLPDELAQALARHQPLVVMVSLRGCPFCEVVRNNYLGPMHEREGLPVVQVDMLDERPTRDTAGQPTTHGALVRAWGVKVAPTVLFIGAQGKEVAPRLAGGPHDFYSASLDGRLEQARRATTG